MTWILLKQRMCRIESNSSRNIIKKVQCIFFQLVIKDNQNNRVATHAWGVDSLPGVQFYAIIQIIYSLYCLDDTNIVNLHID